MKGDGTVWGDKVSSLGGMEVAVALGGGGMGSGEEEVGVDGKELRV